MSKQIRVCAHCGEKIGNRYITVNALMYDGSDPVIAIRAITLRIIDQNKETITAVADFDSIDFCSPNCITQWIVERLKDW